MSMGPSSSSLFPCDSCLVFRSRSQSELCRSRSRSCSRSRSPPRGSRSRSRSRSPYSRSRSQSPDSPIYRSQSPESPVSPDSRTRGVCRPVSIEGSKVDIVSLLCNSSRDFLVDKNGNKISVSRLLNSGKYVIIHCFEVPVRSFSHDGELCWALKASLSTPLWSNSCQLVVALKMRSGSGSGSGSDDLLYSFLSALPNSLAIPLWDSASYTHLSEFLRPLAYDYPALVLDPNHTVLSQTCYPVLSFGANSFPFTDDHLSTLLTTVRNYQSIQRPVPLEDLLGLRLDDSLSNLTATSTTCVSDLKNKLVGLYLFHVAHLSTQINTVYQQCQQKHLELEIVVVYISLNDNPIHFNACATEFLINQGITSWWVLPLDEDDSTSRRLWNLCHRSLEEKLVIVGPQGQFLEINGVNAITKFDPIYDMYPYAAEPLALQHTARLQNLTLESLLCSSTTTTTTHDCLLTQQGHYIPVKHLRHKRVLLFIANLHPEEYQRNVFDDIIEEMTDWCNYNKKYYHNHNNKSCSDDVTLVFAPVLFSNHELPLFSQVLMALFRDSTIPWLICPPGDDVREARIVKDITLYGFNSYKVSCFTFREDGRIISNAWPTLSNHNWTDDQLYSQLLFSYAQKLNDYGFPD